MSFEIPEDRGYLESHEWIHVEDGVGTVGITDFAQDELGDVIFVELPAAGDSFDAEEKFGVVESIKAVSDLYLPVAGTVTEVNEALIDEPERVNEDPYGEGWMLRVEVEDADAVEGLLTAKQYREQTE